MRETRYGHILVAHDRVASTLPGSCDYSKKIDRMPRRLIARQPLLGVQFRNCFEEDCEIKLRIHTPAGRQPATETKRRQVHSTVCPTTMRTNRDRDAHDDVRGVQTELHRPV